MRVVLLFLFFALASCHIAPATRDAPPAYDAQKALGTYQGSFGSGLIIFVVNYINGNVVSGFEVHKGIRRNFNGTVTTDGSSLRFELKEPGDYVMDGIFKVKLDTASMKIEGNWAPLKSGESPDKQLSLQRYNVSGRDMGWDYFTSSSGNMDTLLVFNHDGTCKYSFYARPGDSTSQQNSVEGTFIYSDNTYRIEWRKNSFTPSQQMTLKTVAHKGTDGSDSASTLEGHGWIFVPMED